MELKECIDRIPDLIEKRILDYTEIEKQVIDLMGDRKKKKIIFVGSGTSLNAASATKYFAENSCGLQVEMIVPNCFLNYNQDLDEEALYVVISQGGATKLVYESLLRIKEKKLINLSITENKNSPVAKESDLALEMGSEHEEFIYRTIGYSTTVVTCCFIEMALSYHNQQLDEEKKKELLVDLKEVCSSLKRIVVQSEQWYLQKKPMLMEKTKCILAGAGYLYETAKEADIKIMEMVPMLTRSFELEELIHGPQNAFDNQTMFFLLLDRQHDFEKVERIKSFINNEIGACVVVGDYAFDHQDMTFNYRSSHFRMLESITFFQVIAYYLALDHGRDLTQGIYPNLSEYIKKTL